MKTALAHTTLIVSSLTALSAGCVDTGDPATITARVTPYQGDASGAYTIVHDDTCDWTTFGLQQKAVPALRDRGLVAGFGIIGSTCADRNMGEMLREFVDSGNELLNHSWTHIPLIPCENVTNPEQSCSDTRPDYGEEIDQVATWAKENIGVDLEFFVYPFDSFDDESIDYLKSKGYLGARAGERGFNSPDDLDPLVYNLDPFRVEFDTYGPEWSIYKKDFDAGLVDNILDQFVDDAIAEGKWALRELHGVEDNSWEDVPLEEYTAHLDHVKELVDAHKLWMDTPTAIAKYLMTRSLCGTPTVTDYVLSFEDPAADCKQYRTKVTVEVSRDHLTVGLLATQDGVALPTWAKDDETAIIDQVDPSKPVELDFEGQFTGRSD